MKRIVCRSTQRIVDDGTVIPAGTPHFEQDAVAEQLIAQKLAAEVPDETPEEARAGETLAGETLAEDEGDGGAGE